MYEVAPGAARVWRALFARVFEQAGVQMRIVEHGWPQPIDALWREPDLGCAFMCGWPFARSTMQPIAAPVPSPARYEGLPRYCSEFLVREASGWTTLEQTFGRRFGWMAENSHSGFNAPRAYLSQFVSAERPSLYAEARGPLGTPVRALEALKGGDVDVVALDSFFLDLCRAHLPERVAGLHCVATTPWTPIPLLVAAPAVDAAVVQRLRQHLLAAHDRPAYAPLLADLRVERFVTPDAASYRVLESMAQAARARRYESIR